MRAQNELVQAQIADVMRQAEKDKAELEYNKDKDFAELQHKYDELEYKYTEMAQKTEVEEAKIVGGAVERIELKAIDAESRRQNDTDSKTGTDDT